VCVCARTCVCVRACVRQGVLHACVLGLKREPAVREQRNQNVRIVEHTCVGHAPEQHTHAWHAPEQDSLLVLVRPLFWSVRPTTCLNRSDANSPHISVRPQSRAMWKMLWFRIAHDLVQIKLVQGKWAVLGLALLLL